MSFLKSIIIALLGLALALGAPSTDGSWSAFAQTPSVSAQLTDAIGANDTDAINALIVANQGDAAVLAQIAGVLLASAKATRDAGNVAGAAVLAALALQSGGLTAIADQSAAMNFVNQSPQVVALLSVSPSAPQTGGSTFASITVGTLVTVNPVYSPNQGSQS